MIEKDFKKNEKLHQRVSIVAGKQLRHVDHKHLDEILGPCEDKLTMPLTESVADSEPTHSRELINVIGGS